MQALIAKERARLQQQIDDLTEEIDYLGFALTDDSLSELDRADLRHDLFLARNLRRTSRRLLSDIA
tara:strand:+ start:687 stop:884 length:198 start_codon:yes stop_codon:yes gene_type:complete